MRIVVPYIGDLLVDQVYMGTLERFMNDRRAQGVSATVNRTLAIVRRILNLAARLWRDEHGLTWLETPPMIQLQDWEDKRPPYPLSWDEQALLFRRLPAYLVKNGAVQGQHRNTRPGGMRATMGVGGKNSRTRDDRLRDSGNQHKE